MGIPIENDYIYSLLFTDDQVILAGDEHDIIYMMRKLVDTYKANGLNVNYKKTKYLVTGGEARDLQIQRKLSSGVIIYISIFFPSILCLYCLKQKSIEKLQFPSFK